MGVTRGQLTPRGRTSTKINTSTTPSTTTQTLPGNISDLLTDLSTTTGQPWWTRTTSPSQTAIKMISQTSFLGTRTRTETIGIDQRMIAMEEDVPWIEIIITMRRGSVRINTNRRTDTAQTPASTETDIRTSTDTRTDIRRTDTGTGIMSTLTGSTPTGLKMMRTDMTSEMTIEMITS